MAHSSFKPQNTPTLIPYLVVRDAEKSIDFYQKSFGFKIKDIARDDKGQPVHVEMQKDDAIVMFCPETYGTQTKSPATLQTSPSISLYIYCEDVDALYNEAIKNGAKSLEAPSDAFWGDRFCKLGDLDNYEWLFATNKP